MRCDKALRVQALFDGELDAAASLEMEQHLNGCTECSALLEELTRTRAALRNAAPYYRADAALQNRIAAALDREDKPARPSGVGAWLSRSRAFWTGLISGGAGAALATAMLMMAFVAPTNETLVAELSGAHVRSLMANHLIDIASSDHHTVKPWFAGQADVSPPVTDFAAQGYPLIGGRIDYIDGRRAAVVVYRRGKHVINVFTWPLKGALPGDSERDGYRMMFWRGDDLAFAAVSDAAAPEIAGLKELILAQAAGNKTPTP
jgi:anti-sigma factor RsiW